MVVGSGCRGTREMLAPEHLIRVAFEAELVLVV